MCSLHPSNSICTRLAFLCLQYVFGYFFLILEKINERGYATHGSHTFGFFFFLFVFNCRFYFFNLFVPYEEWREEILLMVVSQSGDHSFLVACNKICEYPIAEN